jgi:hypothetical protein
VSIATAILVPAALVLTLGSLLLSKARERGEAEEKQSLFYLQSCERAYEEAWLLLSDHNNDRVKWTAAARAITHAKDLSAKVTLEAHRNVLEVYQLKYRHLFAGVIRDRPAAFFYGVEDTSMSLDDAARASSKPDDCLPGPIKTSTSKRRLSEEFLHIVWEAADLPKDYQDPLDGRRFSEKDKHHLRLLDHGLYAFLEHAPVRNGLWEAVRSDQG